MSEELDPGLRREDGKKVRREGGTAHTKPCTTPHRNATEQCTRQRNATCFGVTYTTVFPAQAGIQWLAVTALPTQQQIPE